MKQELAPLAAKKAFFDYDIKQVIQSGDIALMHMQWTVSGPQPLRAYAIEVGRRQPDGTWRWLIGDPFPVFPSARWLLERLPHGEIDRS